MKKIIEVDADIIGMTPLYLKSRRDALPRIHALLDANDYEALWVIAHNLHGSGGGFGLDCLSELGVRMGIAAKAGDKAALAAQVAELEDFLDTVELRPVEPAK